MTINEIKHIFHLRKQKRFDEIYDLYGKDIYLIMTPEYHQDMDIDKLLKEKRYFALYEKYGDDLGLTYIEEMQKSDIEDEIGPGVHFVNFLFFENCKRKLLTVRNTFTTFAFLGTFYFSSILATMCLSSTNLIEKNAILYENEIDEYNKEIEDYAKYINGLGLSDLEIIVKVMNDMWSNVYASYELSDYDILGYYRLSLYYDGYGVCRNMADDFTSRMNAINPNYEACNLTVYINGVEINDVRGLDNTIYVGENDNDDFFRSNHLVSCIKLKEENVLLIVDPTNPSIGILNDGNIIMLSDNVSSSLHIRPLGQIKYGINSIEDSSLKSFESYLTYSNIDTLKEKYGINAQNEALERISNLDTEHYKIKNKTFN